MMINRREGPAVLHVTAGMDPKMGGVSQAVRTMVGGLLELGVHNEVVSLDSTGGFSGDRFDLTTLGPAKGPWSYSDKLLPWLLKNLPRFEVVIVHGLWLYHGYAVRRAIAQLKAELKGKAAWKMRLYVMPHGMLDPYFQKAEGRKIKALRNELYWKFIEAKLVNDACGLLFTCEEELILARQPFRPYFPKQESVVGLGVDEPPVHIPGMGEAFFSKCPEVTHSPFFLFISRINEKKGVDLLITAYKAALQRLESVSADWSQAGENSGRQVPKLVIAGPGLDTEYGRSMLNIVANDPQLKECVFFPGMLSGNAKWGAFYHSEAFVLPSHQENFGIAVVEALACSKPVLISNKVNIWREIETMGGGLVEEDTASGTETSLCNWVLLPSSAKKVMASSAREAFQKYFATGPAINRLAGAIEVLRAI